MKSYKIHDKLRLIAHLNQGNSVKYLFFWGHQPKQSGVPDKSCFSQWFEAGFVVDCVHYPTAEHFMMAEKARLFGDTDICDRILNAKHPGEVKKLGRLVKGFDHEQWKKERFAIVAKGNLAKFGQNEGLKTYLIGTSERILVEASPRDRIWGIGLTANDPNATRPSEWPGLNLLGFALMDVRKQLASSG